MNAHLSGQCQISMQVELSRAPHLGSADTRMIGTDPELVSARLLAGLAGVRLAHS
jgi:hypothetical protein